MKLKLIGKGKTKDGGLDARFTVTEATTKKGLEGIMGKLEITSILDADALRASFGGTVHFWKNVLTKPTVEPRPLDHEQLLQLDKSFIFGFDAERINQTVLDVLHEGGKPSFTISVWSENKPITDPALIRARLEQLKKELPD